MKLHLSPYRRRLLIIAISIVAIVLAWPWIKAPKFSSIKYTHTDTSYDCLAMITDATCYEHYYYTATGTESEIAKKLQAELEKRGYSLGPDENNLHISCGISSKDGPDQYSYNKPKKGFKYDEELFASFYVPDSKLIASQLDYEHMGYGCSNLQGTYVIQIIKIPAQK